MLLLLIGYGIFAMLSSGKAATDDAQVAADIVPVAARVAGQVTTVYIAREPAGACRTSSSPISIRPTRR